MAAEARAATQARLEADSANAELRRQGRDQDSHADALAVRLRSAGERAEEAAEALHGSALRSPAVESALAAIDAIRAEAEAAESERRPRDHISHRSESAGQGAGSRKRMREASAEAGRHEAFARGVRARSRSPPSRSASRSSTRAMPRTAGGTAARRSSRRVLVLQDTPGQTIKRTPGFVGDSLAGHGSATLHWQHRCLAKRVFRSLARCVDSKSSAIRPRSQLLPPLVVPRR